MRSARFCRFLLLWVCFFVIYAPNGFAQAVYGSIFGTVTDASGAALTNAKITITNVRKGTIDSVTTNTTGNYTVQHLIPDTYNIRIEAQGFKAVENKNVVVSADTAARVDATLPVGGSTEIVDVTGELPQLKTDRADVAGIIDGRSTVELPISNRNFTALELLTPGTTFQSGWQHGSTENPQQSQQIFVNGQKFGGTSWQLDGTDNRDPVLGIIVVNPTLESVSEVKITTQNYDAEFGNATAGIITAQTKSGSNTLHGSLFEYRRSGDNQARDPFTQYAPDPATGKLIPPTLWNQFGGSIGGPIVKDKLFFFADYQGTRRKTGTTIQATVPTQLVRNTCLSGGTNCNLSEYLGANGQGQVYNPATGNADGSGRTALANNQIPAALLNSEAAKILSMLPAPNRPGITNNYIASGTGGFDDDAFNTRIDYQLRSNFHIFGRYSFANYNSTGRPAFADIGGPGFGDGQYAGRNKDRNQSLASGFDYAISSTLLTDFRLGYFRYHIGNNKWDAGVDAAQRLGLPGLNTGSFDTSGLPTFQVAGLTNFGDNVSGCNCPLTETESQFQFVNNWTKVLGNHSFKFGADIRYATNLRSASDNNRTGLINFDASNTADAVLGGGLGIATFLMGDVSRFSRYVVANNDAGEHQKRIFFYAQDTWRVTPRLTLTYGLRWEDIFPETVSIKGQGGFVNFTTGYVVVAGAGGNPTNGGQENNLRNFAPRIGVAYQVTPKTAVRAGWGRSFDEGVFGTIFGTALTHNIPVVANQTFPQQNIYTAVFGLSAGPTPYVFPTVPSNGLIPLQNGVSYPSVRPPKMELPEVDFWNLSIQRQLTNTTSFEVAYVANKGQHVYAGYCCFNINQPRVGPGPQVERRPYHDVFSHNGVLCCDGDLSSVAPDAENNYNSLQMRFDKRFSQGLQMTAFYTWSKALDHSDDYFANDPAANYGPTDYNRAHSFTLSLSYELPFGHGKTFGANMPKWVDYLIGGYQINSITTLASGLPFTWSYSECRQDVDTGPCRPDNAGSMSYGAGTFDPVNHKVQYFVPVAPLATNGAASGAFARPDLYQFGNVGRNSATGPGMFTSDFSINKNISITERLKSQFRVDAYNLFNHPVLGLPNTCVDCTTGNPGQITSLQPYTTMRRLQFGLRFSF